MLDVTTQAASGPPGTAAEVDVLLVVPPFAALDFPCLGVHLLQACAAARGHRVGIWYANLALAATVGLRRYAAVCQASHNLLAGERLFARSAYRLPPLGRDADAFLQRHRDRATDDGAADVVPGEDERIALDASDLLALEETIGHWVDAAAATLAGTRARVVGCTTMFDQTAASVALLTRLKHHRPDVVTLIGGANCEGPMAAAVAALAPAIDHVFSGESEASFVDVLARLEAGDKAVPRVVAGAPCRDLDALPTPAYGDYTAQLAVYLPALAARPDAIRLPYESSRGCWWGQKHHCTFCGLNGEGMGFRQKSAQRVLDDLQALVAHHGWTTVQMTDNIMPRGYLRSLVPRLAGLAAQMPGLRIFYEQKANLTLEDVRALAAAGITRIQPGIEALSTALLQRMDKGVTAAQNVALLRYARSVQVRLDWNLLWGFPGDQREDYLETLHLLPLLAHLQPPTGFFHLSIDRFSPYHEHPERYGISRIAPWPGFEMVLPAGADAAALCYHFAGEYQCASRADPALIASIDQRVGCWQAAWARTAGSRQTPEHAPPVLRVTRGAGGGFVLEDTRGLPGGVPRLHLSHGQAAAALARRRPPHAADLAWALEHGVGVLVPPGTYVPLATAAPELLAQFERHPLATTSARQATAAPLAASPTSPQ